MQSGPDQPEHNPMNHPEEQPTGAEGSPKFGRLLAVLVAAIVLIGVITIATEAYFSK
jgi:hypothetical protein